MPQRGLAWQFGSQTVLTLLLSAIEKGSDENDYKDRLSDMRNNME